MKRVILASFLAMLASPGFGQSSPTEVIINALKSRGYKIVLQERTWLGRERVVAESANKRREVVFNPGTGEILRDYVSILRLAELDAKSDVGVTVGAAADTGLTRDSDADQEFGIATETGTLIDEPVANPIADIAP